MVNGSLIETDPLRTEQPSMLDEADDQTRAESYRADARVLRQLAAEVRFDFCRQRKLIALAEGFERLADKMSGSPAKVAAD